jgi:serine/threonine protein kinase
LRNIIPGIDLDKRVDQDREDGFGLRGDYDQEEKKDPDEIIHPDVTALIETDTRFDAVDQIRDYLIPRFVRRHTNKTIGPIFRIIKTMAPDIEFTFSRIINGGGNSIIALYNNGENVLVAKFGDVSYDIFIIKQLNKTTCKKLIIPTVILEKDGIKCLIMPYLDGTLSDLIEKTKEPNNKKFLLNILYSIVITLNCLKKQNIFYADLKPANVFYRVNGDGTIQIMLGDFGLAGRKNEKAASTYPPVMQYLDGNVRHSEELIAWEIGMLTLNLSGISTRAYEWDAIDRDIFGYARRSAGRYYRKKLFGSLRETSDPFTELIEKTLCLPADRWNLDEILYWILGELSQELPQ